MSSQQENQKEHFVHNIYMAEIANCIINGMVPLNDEGKVLFSEDADYQVGVKEIIGLYLLIPYINDRKNQLKYDQRHEQISIYNENEIAFKDIRGNEITMKNLRNTICHSFVSCDLQDGKNPVIVFDDRIIMEKKEHNDLANSVSGSKCILVKPNEVLQFLKKSFSNILAMYQKESE